jgi:hypothetical protein
MSGDTHAVTLVSLFRGRPDPSLPREDLDFRSGEKESMRDPRERPQSRTVEERLMATTYESVSDLKEALKQAAEAHGEHENRTDQADPDWPDSYALYMVRERAGEELPT